VPTIPFLLTEPKAPEATPTPAPTIPFLLAAPKAPPQAVPSPAPAASSSLRGAKGQSAKGQPVHKPALVRVRASADWQQDVLAALQTFEDEVKATHDREAEAHATCTQKTALTDAAQQDVEHELEQARAALGRHVKTATATNSTAEEVAAEVAALTAEAGNASADVEAARQRADARVKGEESVQAALETAISILKPHAALKTTTALLETMVQQSAEAAAAAWADFADTERSLRASASAASKAAGEAATRLAQLRGRAADMAAATVAEEAGVAELEAEQEHLLAFSEAVAKRCSALLESFAARRDARAEELRGISAARAAIETLA